MKRSGWLKRKTRLKPIGRRGKRMRETQVFGPFADWIRSRPCDVCGTPPPSDPHHVRSRGAGHGDWIDGRGNLLPLCRPCHRARHDGKVPASRTGVEIARARIYGRQYLAAQEE